MIILCKLELYKVQDDKLLKCIDYRAGLSNRLPQDRVWPSACIYVALKGITNKIILRTYEIQWKKHIVN